MSVFDAVRSAISAGRISQLTIEELNQSAATTDNNNALTLLANAMTFNFVSVVEV